MSSLARLEENPHNLMRSLGDKKSENWYLMLLRNQSKEMLDEEYMSDSIYREFTSYIDKAEGKLSKEERPYIETEQMLALCKSQIPTWIADKVLDLIREYCKGEKSR